MEIEYKDGYAYVDGYKFRRDKKTGYYLCSTTIGSSRPRLHVYMWSKYNGKIPKGNQIHHKDENKNNNEISNLLCMTRAEHLRWHADNMDEALIEKYRRNLNEKARPKAIEWHKSKEGREWHSKHSKGEKEKKIESVCKYCGKTYLSKISTRAYYCSGDCRSADRRKSGIDNERRNCVICGSEFVTNKYSKAKTCSKACANISTSKTKRAKK